MKSFAFAVASANMAAMVAGHGLFLSPTPRPAGSALESACGTQVYYMRSSDPAGNIQGELQVVSSDYNAAECHIWQCAGHQFADNSANVQSWTAGEVVPLQFEIKAPHKGTANVSIVDTATNTIIGSPLISWSDFADNSLPTQSDQESFSVTIPSDLGSQCATAGACVLQHFWNSPSVDQTYESCIDFTVGGSGSSAASSSAASSSVAATSSVAASSSVASSSAVVSSAESTSVAPVTTSAAASSTPATSVAAVATSSAPYPLGNSTYPSGTASSGFLTSTKTKKPCKVTSSASASVSTAVAVVSTDAAVATGSASSATSTGSSSSSGSSTGSSSSSGSSTGSSSSSGSSTGSSSSSGSSTGSSSSSGSSTGSSSSSGSSTGSSTGSTSTSASSTKIEQIIDLIMQLLEEILGVSTTSKKMKRSHARDVRARM